MARVATDWRCARNPAERHRAMSWAQRLKRVFRIEIESCESCGGKVREVPANAAAANRPRGPPGQGEFDLN